MDMKFLKASKVLGIIALVPSSLMVLFWLASGFNFAIMGSGIDTGMNAARITMLWLCSSVTFAIPAGICYWVYDHLHIPTESELETLRRQLRSYNHY